jgi:hypothetical protein
MVDAVLKLPSAAADALSTVHNTQRPPATGFWLPAYTLVIYDCAKLSLAPIPNINSNSRMLFQIKDPAPWEKRPALFFTVAFPFRRGIDKGAVKGLLGVAFECIASIFD